MTPEEFARHAHRNQVRTRADGTTEPYAEHCARVASAVAVLCDDPEVVAAAWLHDTIEDCGVTHRELGEAFGDETASLVVELTDEYGPAPGWNRLIRKALEAKRLGGCSWRARLIKLCDVADNARDIEGLGGEFAEVWRAEKAVLVRMLMGGWNVTR